MSSTHNSPVQTSDGSSTSSLATPTETTSEIQGNYLYQENLISLIKNSVRCETNNQRLVQELQEKRLQLSQRLRQKRHRTNSTGNAAEAGISSTSSESTDVDHFDDFDSDEEGTILETTAEMTGNSALGEEEMNKSNENKNILDIRKERNRMHAKLTRNRKKLFTKKILQTINNLEQANAIMRTRIMMIEEKRQNDKNGKPTLSLPPPAAFTINTYINGNAWVST